MFLVPRRMLAACATLFSLNGCATAPAPADGDLCTGFTLIDPATEARTENAYMLVAGGRIVATGRGNGAANIPAERRHDMSGAYALPGLIDTHAHVTLGRLDVRSENGAPVIVATSEDEITAHNARMLASFGVTTIRNPGGSTQANAAYNESVRTGALLGREQRAAGEILGMEADVVFVHAALANVGRTRAVLINGAYHEAAAFRAR